MSEEEGNRLVCARFASWIYNEVVSPEDARVELIREFMSGIFDDSVEQNDRESYYLYATLSLFFGLSKAGTQHTTFDIAACLKTTRDQVITWLEKGLEALAQALNLDCPPSLQTVLLS